MGAVESCSRSRRRGSRVVWRSGAFGSAAYNRPIELYSYLNLSRCGGSSARSSRTALTSLDIVATPKGFLNQDCLDVIAEFAGETVSDLVGLRLVGRRWALAIEASVRYIHGITMADVRILDSHNMDGLRYRFASDSPARIVRAAVVLFGKNIEVLRIPARLVAGDAARPAKLLRCVPSLVELRLHSEMDIDGPIDLRHLPLMPKLRRVAVPLRCLGDRDLSVALPRVKLLEEVDIASERASPEFEQLCVSGLVDAVGPRLRVLRLSTCGRASLGTPSVLGRLTSCVSLTELHCVLGVPRTADELFDQLSGLNSVGLFHLQKLTVVSASTSFFAKWPLLLKSCPALHRVNVTPSSAVVVPPFDRAVKNFAKLDVAQRERLTFASAFLDTRFTDALCDAGEFHHLSSLQEVHVTAGRKTMTVVAALSSLQRVRLHPATTEAIQMLANGAVGASLKSLTANLGISALFASPWRRLPHLEELRLTVENDPPSFISRPRQDLHDAAALLPPSITTLELEDLTADGENGTDVHRIDNETLDRRILRGLSQLRVLELGFRREIDLGCLALSPVSGTLHELRGSFTFADAVRTASRGTLPALRKLQVHTTHRGKVLAEALNLAPFVQVLVVAVALSPSDVEAISHASELAELRVASASCLTGLSTLAPLAKCGKLQRVRVRCIPSDDPRRLMATLITSNPRGSEWSWTRSGTDGMLSRTSFTL
jgi:hypothetical protein